MPAFDTLIRAATVYDGGNAEPEVLDVALRGDRIAAIGRDLQGGADKVVEARGLALAPGFIDVHTHDDLAVIRSPRMEPKISQGVTTVIVGNCGISAATVTLREGLPDPMNLLGAAQEFCFPTFSSYKDAIRTAAPAVNVAALVGHTALRNNHMDRLDRAAKPEEVRVMQDQLQEALDGGALGLSTGLAYLSAFSASTEEVLELAMPLAAAKAVYVTHMRTEGDAIGDAMEEAFGVGKELKVPVIVSHLKCAGIDNWGRSYEVLEALEGARAKQNVGCDCYPYAASSSTLDLRQVDERVEIMITWSTPHPDVAGQSLKGIAAEWQVSQREAARQLQPAGAIYHSMHEEDMQHILRHPATMIGSDGLPCDPLPHPRLWGTFPRVLGHYCRGERLLTLAHAIHKMTGMPAGRFGIAERGLIREGYYADLTLFNPETIIDTATFAEPRRAAAGIEGVWVNGKLSYTPRDGSEGRHGRFVSRGKTKWVQ
jgi:N-acyl-D-amino-acid deacylase